MPKVRLGNYEVSRLISGSNQLYGYGKFNTQVNQLMTEWATPEHVCEVFRRCEQNGINATLLSYDFPRKEDPLFNFKSGERHVSDLKRHWAEGGRIQCILLTGIMPADSPWLRKMLKLKPIGIAHHGGATDGLFRKGEMGKVREYLKVVRDSGVTVGLSMHNPAVMDFVEGQGWDIDFYMTCFYELSRTAEECRKLLGGKLPLGLMFLPDDPERMCRMIRQTRKTCVAFKILADGRSTSSPEEVEKSFGYAFESIKPQDCVLVGMYPRYKDEVRENADLVKRICAKPS
jgi:hypothetical protein